MLRRLRATCRGHLGAGEIAEEMDVVAEELVLPGADLLPDEWG